uniref:Uncharacterized protein n=1 Tax=Knipowitschia caucasica TaxID=637954 RepID=A0AAV2LNP9_KNICA
MHRSSMAAVTKAPRSVQRRRRQEELEDIWVPCSGKGGKDCVSPGTRLPTAVRSEHQMDPDVDVLAKQSVIRPPAPPDISRVWGKSIRRQGVLRDYGDTSVINE